MNDFVTTLGAGVALIAALVAAIVAVEQLTLPARLRRVADWAAESATHETKPERTETLSEIRAVAIARLVGGVYVPSRRFLEPLTSLAVGPVLIVSTIRSDAGAVLVATALGGLVASTLGGRRLVRVYLERQRISMDFYNGVHPIPPPRVDIVALMEDGTRKEFVWGIRIAASLCLLAGSSQWLLEQPEDERLIPFMLSIVGGWALGTSVGPLRQRSIASRVLKI